MLSFAIFGRSEEAVPEGMPRRAKRLIVNNTRKAPGDVQRLRLVSAGGDVPPAPQEVTYFAKPVTPAWAGIVKDYTEGL